MLKDIPIAAIRPKRDVCILAAAMLALLPSIFVVFRTLPRTFVFQSELKVQSEIKRSEWHVIYSQRENSCDVKANSLETKCLASPSNHDLWKSPYLRSDSEHDQRLRDSPLGSVTWLGTTISNVQVKDALVHQANVLILGWPGQDFEVWVNGKKALSGNISDDVTPIMLPMFEYSAEGEGALHIAIAIRKLKTVIEADDIDYNAPAGFTDHSGAEKFKQNAISSWQLAPLMLGAAFLAIGLIIVLTNLFVWYSSRYFLVGLFFLVDAAHKLRINLIFQLHQGYLRDYFGFFLEVGKMALLLTSVVLMVPRAPRFAKFLPFITLSAFVLISLPHLSSHEISYFYLVTVSQGVFVPTLCGLAWLISLYALTAQFNDHGIDTIERKDQIAFSLGVFLWFVSEAYLRSHAIFRTNVRDAQIIIAVAFLFQLQRYLGRRRSEQLRFEIAAKSAAQVAHDIRSPLAAIKAASVDVGMSNDSRELLSIAVKRIASLAEDLSPESRQVRISDTELSCDLNALLRALLKEKRAEYASTPEIQIIMESAMEGTAFVVADSSELSRVISNIINNGVEALDGAGTVRVSVAASAEKCVVSVVDSGHGVPAELAPKLGRRGVTFGKLDGAGLGLYYAFETLKKWKGGIRISSAAKGTSVDLTLRKSRS